MLYANFKNQPECVGVGGGGIPGWNEYRLINKPNLTEMGGEEWADLSDFVNVFWLATLGLKQKQPYINALV